MTGTVFVYHLPADINIKVLKTLTHGEGSHKTKKTIYPLSFSVCDDTQIVLIVDEFCRDIMSRSVLANTFEGSMKLLPW